MTQTEKKPSGAGGPKMIVVNDKKDFKAPAPEDIAEEVKPDDGMYYQCESTGGTTSASLGTTWMEFILLKPAWTSTGGKR